MRVFRVRHAVYVLVISVLCAFAADIILDEEPWLNSTTACSFPEPFFQPSVSSQRQPKEKEENHHQNVGTSVPNEREPMEKYIGQYGNFAFGNLTVVIDDVTEDLVVSFDVTSCVYRNYTHFPMCYGLDEFWFLSFNAVYFDEQNNPSQFIDVQLSPDDNLTRFERDLMLEDAPAPTDGWPHCEFSSPCDSQTCLLHSVNFLRRVFMFKF